MAFVRNMSLEIFVMTDEKSCVARIKPEDEKDSLFIPRIGDSLSFASVVGKYRVKDVNLGYDYVNRNSSKNDQRLIGIFVYVSKE